MTYDVFISYSSKDQKVAEGICGYLESHGIRCFVAYRDIPKGKVWAAAIVEALNDSKMMVVVFSQNFNMSDQVDREIELASEDKKPILTYRITDDTFKGAKRYYLKNLNWIDAFPNPEHSFGTLYENILKLLSLSKKEYFHDYVDLGLPSGVMWATCNIGSEDDKPEGYGQYFAWGETSMKANYTWANLKYRKSGESWRTVKFTRYVTNKEYGSLDNKTILDLEDDAAHVNWGGNWRMPTKEEWEELFDEMNCIHKWTQRNRVSGFEITSKINGRTIFLPAAGGRADVEPDGSTRNDDYTGEGELSIYWSSSLDRTNPYTSYRCNFDSFEGDPADTDGGRYCGLPVRPVCNNRH